jgi:hypothetical protein
VAFPQSVLPVRVRIAPGGQPAADPATWVWVDITSDVRVASGITIDAGRSDEGNKVDPGKCTLTLDNRSGNYSTRNALGQWYGKLAKGTPLRVGTIAVADTFNRTVASGWGTTESGQAWSNGGSSFSVTPGTGLMTFAANGAFITTASGSELLDIDGRYTAAVPAVMTGGSLVTALIVRYLDANNYYWLTCEFNPAGTVTTKIRRTLNNVLADLAVLTTVPGVTYTAGTKLTVRVQADGPALRVKIWAASGSEPDAWTLTASDSSIFAAGRIGLYLWSTGSNTNTKPFTVSLDDLEVEAIEFTGTVPEWPPRWDQSRKDATTPITAAGILRRLQQGKSPLRSPIARMLLRNSPVAYWPLEDADNATAAAPGMPGVSAASARSVQFAQDSPKLYGAKQTTGITASTVMAGAIPSHTATGTWGVVFFTYLLAPPAATTRLMTVTSTGTVRTWAVDSDSSGYTLSGYDSDNSLVAQSGAPYPDTVKPPGWVAFDLLVSQSGSTITGKLIKYGVTGVATTPLMYVTTAPTFSGSAGSPTGWKMQGSLGFNGGNLAHVAAFNYEPPFVTYAFANAANGYIGETAADRITRLCAEETVQVVVDAGISEPLGAQNTDTFLNLLYAAESADLGILYERGAGLAYRPRGARYNRPVEFALDFTVGDVADPPEPTDDDQNLRNQWTVTRDGGSSAVATDQASVDASGLLDDSETINVATDLVLPDHASWRLATTTVDEYRWPKVDLNLARNTGQIRKWRAAQPFPRMTIAHEPSQVAGNAVDVTVLGYSQNLSPFGWDIELNCAPSSPWSDIAVYDASRKDSASTTLASAIATTTATSVAIKTTNPVEVWSTTAGYDWAVAGERMTVTSITAAVFSGGTYNQTATVTRAVNGVAKTHTVGTEVHLADRVRYAL